MFIFLNKELSLGKTIYPKKNDIFNAFKFTPFEKIKVVIIGQDPYYHYNQAHGLAFSVLPTYKPIPASLKNIYKEIKNNFNYVNVPNNGYLKKWADQGILLLNSVLTVESGKPNSHKNIGWEIFTNTIIKIINHYKKKVIFVLWGNYAKRKEKIIDNTQHFLLKSSHPSPFSANHGFFGCEHFIKINTLLKKLGKKPIQWF
ncbi:uracil-DNA glycosylase [Candidatus Tachikawaea gelatinosa]|uniref:Uracil-DNA glycosylase n=1 Tax=Candidatus Tachikawaea gelatinosa TaxID=1410383 RepID=A0A090ALG6_9ENTR|nr:uracil-DNA glycosylase [Candidatus Tachikawaea gelatinosa]BAP58484.1 uracil-DNA glycosylase [Candidatus Tachikawaea gelatinosa]